MRISLDKTISSLYDSDNGNGPSTPNERGKTSAGAVRSHSMAGLPAPEPDSRERSFKQTKTQKPMRSRQLYAAVTTSIAGTVYFDLPSDTVIRQINLAVHTSASASAADHVVIEVSTSSSGQQYITDAQGIIAIASFEAHGGGSPGNVALTNQTDSIPAAYPGKKGDRVYLNVTESGSATWYVRCLVWFD